MSDDLTRLIAEASVLAGAAHPCTILGHSWRHIGGRNCGCEGIDADGERWSGSCSVPVYRCEACSDYDYGDNAEAADTMRRCAEEAGHE
jgi:hypothetical protein